MPAPNLAQYKKLRKNYREVEKEYLETTSNIELKASDLGIDDLENALNILQSLEYLEPEVSELTIKISATLDTNDLKTDAKSDFKEMFNNLNNYKLNIETIIREIKKLLKY